MLVLSRRKDETIMIGDDIEITIVDVRGDTVRLGIQAPRSVSVHRKEIYNAIQAENIAAATENTADQSAVGGLGQLLKGGDGQGISPLSGLGKLSGSFKGNLGGGLNKLGPQKSSSTKKISIRKKDDKNQ